jgi:hypothetical protein
MFDSDRAVKTLDSQALPGSHSQCGEYTRKAIEAGGIVLARRHFAKDYGISLQAAGFVSMGQLRSGYLRGDVVVIEPIDGHPSGHMAMFNGTNWVSDFQQLHGLYPGLSYRMKQPRFTIYRYGGR